MPSNDHSLCFPQSLVSLSGARSRRRVRFRRPQRRQRPAPRSASRSVRLSSCLPARSDTGDVLYDSSCLETCIFARGDGTRGKGERPTNNMAKGEGKKGEKRNCAKQFFPSLSHRSASSNRHPPWTSTTTTRRRMRTMLVSSSTQAMGVHTQKRYRLHRRTLGAAAHGALGLCFCVCFCFSVRWRIGRL